MGIIRQIFTGKEGRISSKRVIGATQTLTAYIYLDKISILEAIT